MTITSLNHINIYLFIYITYSCYTKKNQKNYIVININTQKSNLYFTSHEYITALEKKNQMGAMDANLKRLVLQNSHFKKLCKLVNKENQRLP